MAEFTFKRRHRLKNKEFRSLIDKASEDYEFTEVPDDMVKGTVDRAKGVDFDVLIVDNVIMFLIDGDDVFPTIRGLLALKPAKRFVTVDMGAVPYVYNGADVMSPGIVEADPTIVKDDYVWVRDIKNKQPLAIGQALMDGPAMVDADKGKAIKSIHHVGDEIWEA